MAKFCGNCGSKMDDSAKVCGNCGTPLDGAKINISNVKYVDPEKKAESRNKVKKMLKLGASVVAVILVGLIAVNTVLSFTGYNGHIRKVMKAYKSYDIYELVSLASDVYYYRTEDEVTSYFENAVGYTLDDIENSLNTSSYKFKYKVNDAYELSNRKTQEEFEQLVSWYNADVSTIEKMLVAKITITAKNGDRTTSEDIELTLTKEGGDWKLLYIE